jgi:hypothetical protein
MSSLAVVPVFYYDQDSSWQEPYRTVSRQEARCMKQTGAFFFIDHGRALRSKLPRPPLPVSFLPGLLETAATITLSEIEANVGIAPTRALVEQAQQKVRAYPHIFDNLAVLARGSWMRPQHEIALGA